MKKNIIVLFGGKSVEHDISLLTANMCLNAIDEEKYNVYPIHVDKNNVWFYEKDFKNNITKQNKKVEVFLKPGSDNLYIKNKFSVKKLVKVDCAILCHHGVNGEDGTIQSVLQLCGIPYSSSSVLSSSITMDKVIMKLLFKQFNFNVVDYDYFTKQEYFQNKEQILNRLELILDYPLIIKPSSLGSSIGIKVVNNQQELINAIDFAFTFDNKILVEKALTNFKEINCAVLGYKDNITVSSLEQPLTIKEILTFEDKYINSNKKCEKRIYPAKVDNKIEKQIKKISEEIFKKFNLSGVVRIDYLLKDNEIFVNEINSIPGSLAYYLFEKENLTFTEVIDKLIDFAILKFNDTKSLTYAFNSSVLTKTEIKK